jgi:hypothetical protein
MKPITLHYSEGLLRRAVRTFWWQGTGWSYVVSLALCCAWLAFRLWSGDRSWVVGMRRDRCHTRQWHRPSF